MDMNEIFKIFAHYCYGKWHFYFKYKTNKDIEKKKWFKLQYELLKKFVNDLKLIIRLIYK